MKNFGKPIGGLICALSALFLLAALSACVSIPIPDKGVAPQDVAPPARKASVTAVQVSDAHFTKDKKLFDNLVRIINDLQPDLIFFTGDQAVSQPSIATMEKYISQISVECPKFAIYGNWERKHVPPDEFEAALYRCGIKVLVNERAHFEKDGMKLNIYGVDDFLYGKPSFAGFAREAGAANVVLAHCPPLFDSLDHEEKTPAIMLSGHTHGGQFTIFGRAVYFPVGTGEYYAGTYTSGSDTLYVSTGLGNSTLEIRNVPPVVELLQFNFHDDGTFADMQVQSLKVPVK